MNSTPAAARQFQPWRMAALICGLVLVCYWPAMHGGLVWDDIAHVPRPEMRSWDGLRRIWFDVHSTQQYYPILFSAFWFEHRLWGDTTFYYHLVNSLEHAASCCLFAFILRRLWDSALPGIPGEKRTIPAGTEWLAALIFAVHPVCVESVAWITEQKNTLSLLFYLLAAFVYLDFEAKRGWRSYALAFAFFLLALGSKSMTVTLPAALLVALWWRKGSLVWRRDVVPLLPWFLASVVSGLFTIWVERAVVGAEGKEFHLTAIQGVLLSGRVVWFYLGKLLWPANLMYFYPRWEIPAFEVGWGAWLGGLLAMTFALWFVRRRFRGPLAGWLFFVGSLFPVMGFFNVYFFVFSFVSDHFQYIASLGVIATLSAGISVWLAGAPRWIQNGSLVLGSLIVATFAFMSNRQCRMYTDSETHYRTIIAQNPECWMAHNNLGILLAQSAWEETESIAQFEAALKLKPDYAEAHNNLGIRLARNPGREAEAEAHYRAALRIIPNYTNAQSNLAMLLGRLPGREAEAVARFEWVLGVNPDNFGAHYKMALTLERMPGREAVALAHYDRALQINPDFVPAHEDRARLLAKLGRALTEVPASEK